MADDPAPGCRAQLPRSILKTSGPAGAAEGPPGGLGRPARAARRRGKRVRFDTWVHVEGGERYRLPLLDAEHTAALRRPGAAARALWPPASAGRAPSPRRPTPVAPGPPAGMQALAPERRASLRVPPAPTREGLVPLPTKPSWCTRLAPWLCAWEWDDFGLEMLV